MNNKKDTIVKLALPKGRMKDSIFKLLNEGGIQIKATERGYRPEITLPGYDTKILKPQNVVEMLDMGCRDVGFAGADWVFELGADLVELLDTGMDAVSVVVAAPKALLVDGKLPKQKLMVASELENITKKWINSSDVDATFVRSYGATEVFPPEDADVIVDITQTGSTLRANELEIIDTVTTSSTRLYASKQAMNDPIKKERIEGLVLVVKSVLEARKRVMLELNVEEAKLEDVIKVLPCMREPTLSELHGGAGYAIKAAVPKKGLPQTILNLKKAGGEDVVVTALSQIVP